VFPRLIGVIEADVCVVGLGGSGLACIDELLRLGASVVGLDAGAVAGAAAGRNGGLLRAGLSLFHHEARRTLGEARAARIHAATVQERERLMSRMPSVARRTGYLRLASDAADERDCREHLSALQADGFPAVWYDGAPGPGVLVPDDAACDPRARCRLEAAAAARGGALLFEHSRAERIERGVVETSSGMVRCRAVVVATDGALTTIFPELRDRAWPTRLQMVATAPLGSGILPHAISMRGGWDYGQQLPDGRIAFGGCRDAGGADERTLADNPTHEVQACIEARCRKVAGTEVQVTHRWAATVSYTGSAIPLIEEVRPGVWAVGAYNGTGNLVGALCGRIAAHRSLGSGFASPFD
jgi:glycine/D-amino acid oxidase-like deaminating enzyme